MLLSFKINIMISISIDEKIFKKGVKVWVLFFAKLSYNQRLKICMQVFIDNIFIKKVVSEIRLGFFSWTVYMCITSDVIIANKIYIMGVSLSKILTYIWCR